MRLPRTLAFVVATLLMTLLLAVPAVARPDAFASGQATLHTMHQSGIMGRVDFSLTAGGAVTATGTATGMAPNTVARYVTLVYDRGSVPGGPDSCEPSPGNFMPGMGVGFWTSDADGNGTLHFLPFLGPVAPLGSFDTTSIRDTTINHGFGEAAVQACGEVALKPATP
jgi:hypothetical protein